MNLFEKIQHWFIGDYLNSVSDYFEQAKIRLTFNLTFLSFFFVTLTVIPLLYHKLYVDFYTSFFVLVTILSVPLILKYKKNLKIASSLYIAITFIALSMSVLFENNNIAFSNFPFYTLHIIFAFFMLGVRWGMAITTTHVFVWLFYARYLLFPNLHNEAAYDSGKIVLLASVFFFGFFMLAYTIIQLINTRVYAETKIKENYNELQTANSELEKYRHFFFNSYDLACIANLNGYFETLNPQFEKILGFTDPEMKAKPFMDFIHPDDVDAASKEVKKLSLGIKTIHFSCRFQTKDGGYVWFNWNTIPDIHSGKLYCIARNITEQRKIELELTDAKQNAEESKVTKELFLASMSHEIRTPLNAIIGFQQLLKETPLNIEQKEYVDSIDFAGKNLLVIIDDILDLSKIEAGKFEFDEIELNISDITKSVVELLSQKAKEKNIKLFLSSDTTIPNVLYGDVTRLTQILINLVGNAIKFTEKGNIKITSRLLEETVEQSLCEFSIEDTGIGIPKDKLAIIFERFSQVNSNITRKHGGTGLGLTISQHLVELQGGTISAQSEEGKGSIFSFKLSFKKKSNVIKNNVDQTILQTNNKKLNILLAEDVLLNQRLVARIMEKWGHHLDIAENGKIALDKVNATDYDLILMDIQMPEMDGYQTATYIRNMSDTTKQNIPIIALTAHASHEESEKCINLGMNAYIAKPFNQQQLQQVIHQLTYIP